MNSSEGLSGHNATTGELLWHIQETNRFPFRWPFFTTARSTRAADIAADPTWRFDREAKATSARATSTWRVDTGAPYVSSLVHYNGLLYMAGDVGVLSAIDAKSGNRVWQERTGGVFTASPVAADGKIYLLSEDGQTIVRGWRRLCLIEQLQVTEDDVQRRLDLVRCDE